MKIKQLLITAVLAVSMSTGFSTNAFAAGTLPSVTPACETVKLGCTTFKIENGHAITLRQAMVFFNRVGKEESFLEVNGLSKSDLNKTFPASFTHTL